MIIETYFPVGVLHHNVSQELADKVENTVVPLLDKLPRGTTQFTDFHENKIEIHTLLPELINEFVKAMNTYRSATSFSINEDLPLQYWTQDYKEGDTHGVHAHGVSGISGIYWARANESAGSLRLYNPNPLTEYVHVDQPENPFAWVLATIKPEKGKMILFPTYLKHDVMPSGPGAIRTAIPFNFPG